MKFLYTTDSHIKQRTPSGRKDEFVPAILEKLKEVGETARKHNAQAIFHGGDLFDTPRIPFSLLADVANIIKGFPCKMYVVPGNHDLFGYNLQSLPHTALGFLASLGIVQLLTRGDAPLIFEENGKTISFEGQEYYLGIDKGNVESDYSVHSTADFKILIPHSMLLPKPFHPDVHCTLVEDVAKIQNKPDLILVGHYHPGFVAPKEEYGIEVINPGSMARLELTNSNQRYPEMILLEWDGSITWLPVSFFSAKPHEEVFDFSAKIQEKQEAFIFEQFEQQLQNVQITETNAVSIAYELAQPQGLTELLSDVLINEPMPTVDPAYVPDTNRVYIKSLELDNFQSHKKTHVSFDNNLSSIIGESNAGKTALFRAMRWLIFNDPSGTEFMREGAKKTSVTMELSNGYTITRYRTQSSAGGYEITGPDGISQKYEGIAHKIPIEVWNAIQVPLIQIGKELISFQVASQLEAPFFIGMSGADRAQWLGMLTGVERLDEAITQTNKRMLQAQRAQKEATTKLDILKKDNEVLSKDLFALERRKRVLEESIAKLKALQEKEQYLNETIHRLSMYEDKMHDAKTDGDKIANLLQRVRGKLDAIRVKASDFAFIEDRVKRMEENIITRAGDWKQYNRLTEDLPFIVARIQILEDKERRMNEVTAYGKRLLDNHNKIEMLKQDFHITNQKLEEAKALYKEVLGDSCPLCKQPIEEGKACHR